MYEGRSVAADDRRVAGLLEHDVGFLGPRSGKISIASRAMAKRP
jgi:hypothetical protein